MENNSKALWIALGLAVLVGGYFGYFKYQEKLAADRARQEREKADAIPRWDFIGDTGKVAIYIHLPVTKEEQNPSMRSTWTKQIKKDGAYSTSLQYIDCKNRQLLYKSYALYNADGNRTAAFDGEDKWVPVAPDTYAETILLAACK